ncbi:hypothetical protein H7X68_00725 [Candidatus Saccharibacteria bacterium]|nr:hypothetical protein [Candidatus Saccharibacteria bacterium]
MNIFASVRVGLLYAAVLVVLSVAQLFSFESLLPIVTDFSLPGGRPLAYFLAAFIVIAEVFALPYLLQMRLSSAMQLVSMVTGWLVAFLWLGIALWLTISDSTVTNIGLLGDVVAVAPGLISILIGLILGILAGWSSWSIRPLLRTKK